MLHSNHKENIYKRYTKDNEKGIKACTYKKRKSTKHKRRQQEKKKRDKIAMGQIENMNKLSIASPSLSVIKCKWFKIPNQKTQSG